MCPICSVFWPMPVCRDGYLRLLAIPKACDLEAKGAEDCARVEAMEEEAAEAAPVGPAP